jgi:6-phospho-beta-glucosidase
VKLAILGGGGFRVPNVYAALLAAPEPLRQAQVALHDTSAPRLAVIEAVLARQAEQAVRAGRAEPPPVTATARLDEALRGADFVFSAIRVGGLEGRANDERVALAEGVLGQETVGAGGIAYGLRTVPVAVDIAQRVARLAPDAWVINFTNPAGMITEAMQSVLGERVIGICDTPSGLGRRIAAAVGLDPATVQLDYAGLNHLGWMRAVRSDGQDVLPGLLADDAALARLEETEIFGAPWLRTLGCIPNEYLYYYYFNTDAVAAIRAQPATRGEFLRGQQGRFYAAAAAEPERALELWREVNAERRALYMAEAKAHGDGSSHAAGGAGGDGAAGGGTGAAARQDPPAPPGAGGYAGEALAVMSALSGLAPATMILNVRGGGALPGLDDDAVAELPATVDAAGVHPIAPATPLTLHQRGLIEQVKAVERSTIEAAVTGSPDAALRAFALHPLVGSVPVARKLAARYQAAAGR